MSKAIEQFTRPAIAGGAVLADAKQEVRPMGLASADGQKRHEQDALERLHGTPPNHLPQIDMRLHEVKALAAVTARRLEGGSLLGILPSRRC
jgi:hypothetical protein